MKRLVAPNQHVNRFLLACGALSLLALMGVATLNVLMRVGNSIAEKFFGEGEVVISPLSGVYELVSFFTAIAVAFGLAYSQRRRDHVTVDMVTSRFPRGIKRVLDGLRYVVSAAFFGLVSWRLVLWGWKLRASHEVSETLRLPFYPVVFAVALGFAMLTVTLLVDLGTTFRGYAEEEHE